MEEVKNIYGIGDFDFQNNYINNNFDRDIDQNSKISDNQYNSQLRENFYGIDVDRGFSGVAWQRDVSQHEETTHTRTHTHTEICTDILTEENLQFYNFESSKNNLSSRLSQNDIQYDKKLTTLKCSLSFEMYEKRLMQKVDNWLRTILSDENDEQESNNDENNDEKQQRNNDENNEQDQQVWDLQMSEYKV
eukprot:TRINITY_DN8460_c0_g2_i1.p3 TRINITY_DN8460_c0_g2~~TRINITY_DN8460_c0_g2_i1.p3  ORF type:complete len:212 (+),score=38.63 TRINITY_DN8460_c0_g2_i1:65-637(+)